VEDVVLLGREEEREHIRKAIASIEETTGERPVGWYCRYGPSVHTRELLVEEGGFTYDCDAYNDDLPYWTTVHGTKHLVVPYSLAANDIKFQSSYGSPKDFEDYLKSDFDRLYKEGETHPKMMSIGCTCASSAGRDARRACTTSSSTPSHSPGCGSPPEARLPSTGSTTTHELPRRTR